MVPYFLYLENGFHHCFAYQKQFEYLVARTIDVAKTKSQKGFLVAQLNLGKSKQWIYFRVVQLVLTKILVP